MQRSVNFIAETQTGLVGTYGHHSRSLPAERKLPAVSRTSNEVHALTCSVPRVWARKPKRLRAGAWCASGARTHAMSASCGDPPHSVARSAWHIVRAGRHVVICGMRALPCGMLTAGHAYTARHDYIIGQNQRACCVAGRGSPRPSQPYPSVVCLAKRRQAHTFRTNKESAVGNNSVSVAW